MAAIAQIPRERLAPAGRFRPLFLCLLGLHLLYPYVEVYARGELLLDILLATVLLSAVYAVSSQRHIFYLAGFLGLASLVADVGGVLAEEIEEAEEEGIPARIYEMPIEELDLTVRAYNCLKRAGITKIGEILEKLEKGEDEILAVRNFGRKSLEELLDRLSAKGLLPPEGEEVAAEKELQPEAVS